MPLYCVSSNMLQNDLVLVDFVNDKVNGKSLTKQERHRIKGAFKSLDLDEDGFLSDEDLAMSMKADGIKVNDKALLDMMWEASEIHPVSTIDLDLNLKKPKLSLRDVQLLFVRGKNDKSGRQPKRLYVYILYRVMDPKALTYARRSSRRFAGRMKKGLQRDQVLAAAALSGLSRRQTKASKLTGDDVFSFLYPIMSTEDLHRYMTRLFPNHLRDVVTFDTSKSNEAAVAAAAPGVDEYLRVGSLTDDFITASHFVQLFKSRLWNRCGLNLADRRHQRPPIPVPPRRITAREKYREYCAEIRQFDHEERLLAHLNIKPPPPLEAIESHGRRNTIEEESKILSATEAAQPNSGAQEYSKPKVKITVEGENLNTAPIVRMIRRLAAKHHISLGEMEHIHNEFAKYDADQSGTISKEEFLALLKKVLRVSGDGVDEARLDRAWQNVRSKRKEEASLEDFTIWYKTHFKTASGVAKNEGMDQVLGLTMRSAWTHDNAIDVAHWHQNSQPARASLRKPSSPQHASKSFVMRRRDAAVMRQSGGRLDS
ncbi:hypothetical protein FOL47_008077 [Perkinsus chesapeaki]|uniref:EF-hand domain-containing protein n=1 Tax=Perkinsus chesapeaki TaxID=330153 RepID=A0A7J6MUG4_PERCH|nr:hypothetical protein FOL47_008077 [Perkinsus chesapeaki]